MYKTALLVSFIPSGAIANQADIPVIPVVDTVESVQGRMAIYKEIDKASIVYKYPGYETLFDKLYDANNKYVDALKRVDKVEMNKFKNSLNEAEVKYRKKLEIVDKKAWMELNKNLGIVPTNSFRGKGDWSGVWTSIKALFGKIWKAIKNFF